MMPEPIVDVAIVGSGIAGAALAFFLRQQGSTVFVLEAGGEVAAGASGNPAAALYPLLAIRPSKEALFYLDAWRFTRAWLQTLPQELSSLCGLEMLDPRAQRLAAAPHYDQEILCPEPGRATLPLAGWVRPRALCQYLLTNVPVRLHTAVTRIEPGLITTADGATIPATHIVLANGYGANSLMKPPLPLTPLAGQITEARAQNDAPPPAFVRCGDGYLIPPMDGVYTGGSSYRRGCTDTSISPAETTENIAKMQALAPEIGSLIAAGDRASVRCRTRDTLPVVGALSNPPGVFILTGFASRGMVAAPYAASLLAGALTGGADVPALLHPQRFG
ncbi:MAG: FAD-dependent oxidoreductase [Holosporales bacterium]